ncbi:MAG: hypothetical protein KGL39_41635 [Patescibacteria group bacterium]|nr:hypothetical protein [Patescibacteria group bacterium]
MGSPVQSLALDNYPIGRKEGSGVAWQSGTTTCNIVPTMDQTTGADTTKSGKFGFEISSDGQNYTVLSSDGWQGGPDTKNNVAYNLPFIGPIVYGSGQTPPAFVRAFWETISGSVAVGLSLQFS